MGLKTTYLSRAAGIGQGDIVSFVGGGGKTSAMFLMGEELSSRGLRTIITTTTHISQPDAHRKTILTNERENIREELSRNGLIVFAGGVRGEKLRGIDSSMVEELKLQADVILVEADGANRKPFKAPLDHEPVIPPSSTVVMPVAGLDAVGKKLSEDNFHRSERIAEIMNMSLGDTVSAGIVAGTILHPSGGMKGVPEGARFVPLLNKADSSAELDIAKEITGILTEEGIKRSVVTSLRSDPPFIMPCGENCNITAVILAAGGSRRMGSSKLDMEIKGVPIMHMVINAAVSSMVSEIIMVVQPGFRLVNESSYPRLKIVENAEWKTGQSSSMKKGLENVNKKTDAVIFLMADQPLITPGIINELLFRYLDSGSSLVAPLYKGKRGAPVIFARPMFDELFMIEGDRGGRELLQRFPVEYVEFDSTLPGMDIDTPADYERLKDLV